MNRKLNFSKHIKKIFVFLLSCVIIISLSGCDSSNRRSTGDLALDATYASAGEYTVTTGELYDELRYNATTYLENAVYKIIFADEIQKIKDNVADYKERLDKEVLSAIYGVKTEDEVADLNDKTKEVKEKTFVDTMYKAGYLITVDDIKNRKFDSVYSNYYLEVAKYLAAYDQLAEEFEKDDKGKVVFGEINDDSYFTKSDVKQWYKENKENKGAVTAVLVRFISSDEAANVLKAFGIKTYNGEWYQIKLDEAECTTKAKYDKYYSSYTVNPTGDNGDAPISAVGNGNATVLKIYTEIYNYIYTNRTPIVTDSELTLDKFSASYTKKDFLKYYYFIQSIIAKDNKIKETENTEYTDLIALLKKYDEDLKAAKDGVETIVMSNEKLNKYNSSLATYVYQTLETEAAEEGKSFTQYMTSAKSYGDYYYLVFKIDQEEDKKLYDVNEDNDEITFTDEEYLKEVLTEMFEEKLDDTYISTVFDERVQKVKLSIYDSIVELKFTTSSQSKLKDKYSKTKKSNKNAVAQVKYNGTTTKITVADLYANLEPLTGPQTAASLLMRKFIKTTDYYKDLEKKYNDYKETIETMLYYFANDSYASYGYPSSIGKYNFMLLYYKTANIDKAIRDSIMVSDATSAFYLDYKGRFEGNKFYENLAKYCVEKMDMFYSLQATAINVYYDDDEDGTPDKLVESDTARNDLAKDLLKEAQIYIKNSHKTYATALSDLIADYNSSSRIEDTTNPTTPEYTWAKYRRAGLYLNQKELEAITDTTTTADVAVQERIKTLFANDDLMNKENGFAASYLDSEIITTKNGYTLLLVTAGTNVANTKYEDKNELYTKVPVLEDDKTVYIEFGTNGFESTKPTVNQVKAYVLDYLTYSDVYALPESVTTTLDTYLLPLINRYTSGAGQLILMQKQLGTITFAVTDAVNPADNEAFNSAYQRATFFDRYIEIQKNSADAYDTTTYPNWWTEMF